MFRLYLVTDRRLVADLPGAVERALSGVPPGSAAVQLREKDLAARELLELARRIAPACRARAAPLLVNDRVDVALAAGAQGVHLGGGSVAVAEARSLLPPGALVGASCHDLRELAGRAGADLVVFGPVFDTPGKGPAVGVEGLRAAAGGPPVFALGGVDAPRVPLVREAGAHGVAAIRSWLSAPDPAAATAALLRALTG